MIGRVALFYIILEDLIYYHLVLYTTRYHHLAHTQAGLAFPVFVEKFYFSAHFRSCVGLFIY